MFIKAQRKPLKYSTCSRLGFGEWLQGPTFTNWGEAHVYAMNSSNAGLCCLITVTRAGYFEYEKMYFARSESEFRYGGIA